MLDRSGCAWGVPARFLQSSAARASRASLPCPHFPVADAGVCAAIRWGSYCWACNLLVLIIYLFFLPVMLPSVSKARHRLSRESVSWCLETSLLKILFPGRSSLPTSFVKIMGQEKPYKNKNAINNGVRISGRGKKWCMYLGHIVEISNAYLMCILYREVSFFFQRNKT